ncbi:hypothetical protein J2W14_002842 [Pseudarthrobacter oxydans]|uniref:hypothetical protein n=1 Tax=Pseudarthrobacter oxydans TaxID=1671 RepID=UPI00278BA583|nr:hypothetical protein [Pseudarthrobacter oxydans]MDP9983421.1 hypothetical protein [Pseudarthrobacter oxydans]
MGEPRMIAILQWTTLAVCALVAIARIPSALRGENRSIFGVFVLSTVAILLSIDVSYRSIDAWLGSENYTNLILRFVVYGTVLLAGYRIAKAFAARKSVRLIAGPAGMAVLAVIGIATVILFLWADTAGTATGLSGVRDRSPQNAALIESYAAAGRLYPAYVAVCILPATFVAMGQQLPRTIRIGALLLTVAFAAMASGSFFPLIPSEVAYLQAVINYTAVLCLALGLALIWISSLMAKRELRLNPR